MKMSIRVATFEDTQIVAELAIQMWESNTVEEVTQEFYEYISKENGTIFLAMVDGCAVGFAQWGLRRDYVEGTDSSPVRLYFWNCRSFDVVTEVQNDTKI